MATITDKAINRHEAEAWRISTGDGQAEIAVGIMMLCCFYADLVSVVLIFPMMVLGGALAILTLTMLQRHVIEPRRGVGKLHTHWRFRFVLIGLVIGCYFLYHGLFFFISAPNVSDRTMRAVIENLFVMPWQILVVDMLPIVLIALILGDIILLLLALGWTGAVHLYALSYNTFESYLFDVTWPHTLFNGLMLAAPLLIACATIWIGLARLFSLVNKLPMQESALEESHDR